MVNAKAKVKFDARKVRDAARKGNIQSLSRAGGAIRLTAKRSIRKRPGNRPSTPGTPPYTKAGRLRNAIVYAVAADKQSVVIGPSYEFIGDVGMAHEFGGQFRDEHYAKRPFMGPALEKIKDRLPSFWAGSVK